jgi:hypothetical protein
LQESWVRFLPPPPNLDDDLCFSSTGTAIGTVTTQPAGGKTKNAWITDTTPPVIIAVAREALAEDVIQVTLQLSEPGTIWCQIADKDSSGLTTSHGGRYCRDMDVTDPSLGTNVADLCYFENFVKGVTADNTVFRADVRIPYQDYDIDLNLIEKVAATRAGVALLPQYHYKVWCFAEDDWAIEAQNAPSPSPLFAKPPGPNKVLYSHSETVKEDIGQVLTLDQTPPTWTYIAGTQAAESILTMSMKLDEQGTIWCMPVRSGFAEPSINEILQNNEYNTACSSTSACTVTMQSLESKTQYDIYCYTEDDNVYPQRPYGRKFTTSSITSTTNSTSITTHTNSTASTTGTTSTSSSFTEAQWTQVHISADHKS